MPIVLAGLLGSGVGARACARAGSVGKGTGMSHRVLPVIALALAGALCAARRDRLPQKYSEWLNRDAIYLITDEEKKSFLALGTDAQRDKFIEDFWDVRNPARGSGRNPFKEEHYARMEYANEHFGRQTNTPGWMTDMGRTYILFGKPASRAPFTGYGQIYPLELWFYSNNAGSASLPPYFYVLFFMPNDIGEYRFYHPFLDGPMKLVRGSRFRTNRDVYRFLNPLGGDLARAAFTLIPGEPLDTQDYQPSMAAEMLVNKLQNFANDSFNVERIRAARELRAQVSSWLLVNQERPLDLSAIALRDFAGSYWLDYAVLVDDPALGRVNPDAAGLTVDFRVRLLSESGETVIEDREERAYPVFEEKTFQPFMLAGRLPVVPGKFRLHVELVNREAGKSYNAERLVAVGGSGRVSISEVMLAGSPRRASRPDAATPFQLFGTQFVPVRAARESLLALFQVTAPESCEIDYLIANVQVRDARRTLNDVVPASEFRDGTLLKSKTLPIGGLEPGTYHLVVSVRAQDSQNVLASSGATFRIAEGVSQPGVFFLSHSKAASSPAVAAYLRGLEWLSQRDEERAAESMRTALEANPSNGFAGRIVVRLDFDRLRYADVCSLYARLGLAPFRSAPETMAQVALSLWHTGDARNAQQVLAAAEASFPNNQLLATAARQIKLP